MSDPGPAGGYAPTESFEAGRVTAAAADADRVALGTETGAVEIVAADGRITVEFDAPVADLAVGNRVYALVDGTVAALSTAGTRVWSVDLPEADELAALPEADVLGVVTDDDALLGFDGETGGREFAVDRPHADVTDDPGFFGSGGAFVLVAWSFLAVRNLDGSERFDENLDGAIESAGVVDDTVVVSLKDERVVGVDLTTGEQRWERELAVTELPDRGEETLLFTAEEQLVSLDADGDYAPVADLPSGDVYPTSGGDLFCAVADGTIAVYRSTADPAAALDVSVAADRLVPGETETVDLAVENAGDRPVAAALRVDGEGVALRETDWEVDLAPGESATHAVSVESAGGDDTAALSVAADGDHIASASLPVEDAPGGSLAADVELDAVTDGAAELAVAVENEGDAPATHVSVSPGDAQLGRLAPGESAETALDVPYEPGTTVPVAVRSDDDAVEVEAALPDRGCDLDLATADGFVDVTVENRTDATVTDDLAVAGDCFDRPVERRVELPPGSRLVVALRPDVVPDAATVEADLVGVGAARSERFDARQLGADGRAGRSSPGARRPSRDGTARREESPRRGAAGEPPRREGGERPPRHEEDGRPARREGAERSPRSERAGSAPRRDADPPRRDADSRREPAAPPRSESGVGPEREPAHEPRRGSGAEPERETPAEPRGEADASPRLDSDVAGPPGDGARTESDTGGRVGPDRQADAAAADSAGSGSGGASRGGAVLSAERRLESTDLARTHGVRERVTVRNEGDERADEVRASFPGETVAVGDVPPGDRATIQRHHAFADVGTVELPAATVEAADADCEVPAERLSVDPADLAAEVAFDPEDGGYLVRVDLENGRDVDCAVERIGTRDLGIWDVDLTVPAGETVEWTRRVEGVALDGAVAETVVEYQFADGEPDRLGTLGRVADAGSAAAEGIDAVAAEIGDETRVSGGYGSVVLEVENRGESPVEDLSVEATGEAVSDLMYGGSESVDRLDPGERFTHFVDVETDGPEATVTVALSADGEETELELRGPAPADEDDWSPAALADWTAERAGDGGDAGADHLVSRFEDA